MNLKNKEPDNNIQARKQSSLDNVFRIEKITHTYMYIYIYHSNFSFKQSKQPNKKPRTKTLIRKGNNRLTNIAPKTLELQGNKALFDDDLKAKQEAQPKQQKQSLQKQTDEKPNS